MKKISRNGKRKGNRMVTSRPHQPDTGALDETKQLFERADRLGLLVKEVADIIGRSGQQISGYRTAAKTGEGYPMPEHHRRTLALYLDRLEARKDEGSPVYPSQKGSKAHDDIEQLLRLTDAKGPAWQAYEDMVRTILRMAQDVPERRRPFGQAKETAA